MKRELTECLNYDILEDFSINLNDDSKVYLENKKMFESYTIDVLKNTQYRQKLLIEINDKVILLILDLMEEMTRSNIEIKWDEIKRVTNVIDQSSTMRSLVMNLDLLYNRGFLDILKNKITKYPDYIYNYNFIESRLEDYGGLLPKYLELTKSSKLSVPKKYINGTFDCNWGIYEPSKISELCQLNDPEDYIVSKKFKIYLSIIIGAFYVDYLTIFFKDVRKLTIGEFLSNNREKIKNIEDFNEKFIKYDTEIVEIFDKYKLKNFDPDALHKYSRISFDKKLLISHMRKLTKLTLLNYGLLFREKMKEFDEVFDRYETVKKNHKGEIYHPRKGLDDSDSESS